jgi:hypothetical protein
LEKHIHICFQSNGDHVEHVLWIRWQFAKQIINFRKYGDFWTILYIVPLWRFQVTGFLRPQITEGPLSVWSRLFLLTIRLGSSIKDSHIIEDVREQSSEESVCTEDRINIRMMETISWSDAS